MRTTQKPASLSSITETTTEKKSNLKPFKKGDTRTKELAKKAVS